MKIIIAVVAVIIVSFVASCTIIGHKYDEWEIKATHCPKATIVRNNAPDDEGVRTWNYLDNCTQCHDKSYACPLQPKGNVCTQCHDDNLGINN